MDEGVRPDTTDAVEPLEPQTSALSPNAHKPALEANVLAELLSARKSSEGLTEGQMARSHTLAALLGNSDPVVALDHLMHSVMEHTATTDDPLAVTAAAYSLGLAREIDSRADTHLARLEAFGEQFGFEQRQARRYSDRGLRELTRLITTTWMRRAQPELHLIVVGLSPESVALLIDTQVRTATPMRMPRLGLSRDDEPMQQVELAFCDDPTVGTGVEVDAGSDVKVDAGAATPPGTDYTCQRLVQPLRLGLGDHTTRFLLRWAPLWPKYSVTLMEQARLDADVVVEAVGNTLGVVISRGK